MVSFLMFIHAIICVLVVVVVLMQSGRGGGLTEGFASAESMFGAQTNAFMTKSTTVLTVLFFITALSLAFLSSQQGKSLMSGAAVEKEAGKMEKMGQSDAVQKEATDKIDEAAATATATVEKNMDSGENMMEAAEEHADHQQATPAAAPVSTGDSQNSP